MCSPSFHYSLRAKRRWQSFCFQTPQTQHHNYMRKGERPKVLRNPRCAVATKSRRSDIGPSSIRPRPLTRQRLRRGFAIFAVVKIRHAKPQRAPSNPFGSGPAMTICNTPGRSSSTSFVEPHLSIRQFADNTTGVLGVVRSPTMRFIFVIRYRKEEI
eukprot:725946-Amphidinium_carterae.3